MRSNGKNCRYKDFSIGNRALPSLHGGSLEIKLTVHLKGKSLYESGAGGDSRGGRGS